MNNWINTDKQLPAVNEQIMYNGNLFPAKGKHIGNGFVELENGDIDQFDEWQPIEKPAVKTVGHTN